MLNNNNFLNKDYITTSGIIINYDDVYVNTPINNESKYKLVYDNNFWKIKIKDEVIINKVNLLLPPQYALNKEKLENGSLVTDYVNVHVDRIRIQPIGGCSINCRFCSCKNKPYNKYDIDILDKCFNIALQEKQREIRHCLISGGTPNIEDYEYLTKVYTHFITKYEDLKFDIMMIPRGFKNSKDTKGYREYIEYLNKIGTDGLAINIELYNDELRKQYALGKYDIGLENYMIFLKNAVDIMGTNRVRSCIIVGLEPIEDTIKGIELLCKVGCMPVLSPYIPVKEIGIEKPSIQTMLKVREEANKISAKYNVPIAPLCKPCSHNTI